MTTPIPEQALARLDAAYGTLGLPDWQQHDSALADAVGGLSDFYLYVDATTGVRDSAPIYLDRSRVVFGLIPITVAPLVRMLVAQTVHLDLALANGWQLPPAEAPAWKHWHDRLAHYVSVLERELGKPKEPSETLWREVTAPLLQGLYPPAFAALGIGNPLVPGKPDVSTVPTTAFMVALQSQEVGRVQGWLLRWRESVGVWAYETRESLDEWFRVATEGAREGVRSVAKTVTIGALAVGLGWLVIAAVRNSAPKRRKTKTPAQEQEQV